VPSTLKQTVFAMFYGLGAFFSANQSKQSFIKVVRHNIEKIVAEIKKKTLVFNSGFENAVMNF
jgi:hypothetical protein